MTRITLGGAVLRGTVSTALVASLMSAPALGAAPVDLSKWSPEYVRSIAGTQDFDTAGDCAKVTPLDYKGRLTFWYQGVFEGDPDLLRQYYKDFFETFRKPKSTNIPAPSAPGSRSAARRPKFAPGPSASPSSGTVRRCFPVKPQSARSSAVSRNS